MENSIEYISICEQSLPLVSDCDILTASEDFFHMDRTADFSVMIYVTDGTMYVTKNEQDYEISAGKNFFLKSGIRHFGKHETLRGTRCFMHIFICPKQSETVKLHCCFQKKYSLPQEAHLQKSYIKCSIVFTVQTRQKALEKTLYSMKYCLISARNFSPKTGVFPMKSVLILTGRPIMIIQRN